MNVKRIVSGLIGMPIVILVFLSGNVHIVDVVVAALALISTHEYIHAFKSTGKAKPISWICYLACIPIAFLHFIPVQNLIVSVIIAVPILVLTLFMHVIISELKITIIDIATTVLDICYIALFFMFIPLTYGLENGKFYIWYLIFIAWGTDVFAYTFGRRIGKHKFSSISPNKSIEGCVAGTIGAVVLSMIYTCILNRFAGFSINYLVVLGVSTLLSLIGQIGDFSASSIKRYTGIKDFSNLIPGHGGILDRFDSFMFIAPFAYFLLLLI